MRRVIGYLSLLELVACMPLDVHPGMRCAARSDCPGELSCYRGFCIDETWDEASELEDEDRDDRDDEEAPDASRADAGTRNVGDACRQARRYARRFEGEKLARARLRAQCEVTPAPP